MKGNLKAQINQSCLFPAYGTFNTFYTSIILINQIIIAFLVPGKLAFLENYSEEPMFFIVYDLFCDVLFFIDIIIKFFTPIFSESRLITDKRQIVKKYLKSWFFIDLIICLPLSYLKWRSFHYGERNDSE